MASLKRLFPTAHNLCQNITDQPDGDDNALSNARPLIRHDKRNIAIDGKPDPYSYKQAFLKSHDGIGIGKIR